MLLRYITHPEVDIDPTIPVPRWRLSDRGRARARAMSTRPWVTSIGRLISSPETKARETAAVLADHLGLTVEIRSGTGEIDRSVTGFVDPDRHDTLTDHFFAEPTRSIEGWESAVDAQRRIVSALTDVWAPTDEASTGAGGPDVAVIGHGGVGTLLMCRLLGLSIDRSHDQPTQGHHWAYDPSAARMVHRWRPIDDSA